MLKSVNDRVQKTAVLSMFMFTLSCSVFAQEMEPRSYSVIPIGLHAALLSYTFSGGDVVAGLNSPVQNLNINASIITLGYVQTFSFFKKLARIGVGMPYAFLNGSARVVGVDTAAGRNGFGDGRIKFGVNLFGSPVLSPKEFQKFQEYTVLGVSVVVSVPLGQYYSTKLINIGSNRWGIKPEIGFSHREGRLFYEGYAGVWFFTENEQYYNKSTLSQNALLSFQAHVDYTFKHGKYLALNGGFVSGGNTFLNGVERLDEQENWRIGATFSTPVFNTHQSVRFMVNTGVATRAGQNFTSLTLAYQYSWF
ncbi:MAG TPA: transporter [Puia sp.]|nr:transporter [Puia sp.]